MGFSARKSRQHKDWNHWMSSKPLGWRSRKPSGTDEPRAQAGYTSLVPKWDRRARAQVG